MLYGKLLHGRWITLTARIRWIPIVLTFSFSSREFRAQDPLQKARARLEQLDIKTIVPFVPNQTTHVVQSKRNTAKGLQALVNGNYIVRDSYLDALEYAATPGDLENEESLCPLETDFDSAWPDAAEHLPPRGQEPTERPDSAYAPDPSRVNVFDGYTFVFGDPSQFETLQDPINDAHGKAVYLKIQDGTTTAEEVVEFMKEAGFRKHSDRTSLGGVVLVRFRAKGQYEPWSIDLSNQVALLTDQRVIEQRDFLDVILGNNAAPLCRPLPSPEPSQAATQAATQRATQAEPEAAPPSSQPPEPTQSSQPRTNPKSQRTRTFVSKMKAFDDDFDMDSVPAYTAEEEPEDVPAMDTQPEQTQRTSPAQEEDVVSDLLPGAAAMKRRLAETDQRHDPRASQAEPEAPKPKRPKLDVRKEARQHREAEEDAARQREQAERADFQTPIKDMDVERMKNLAIVEEIDMPLREQCPIETTTEAETRWDERWNGRKNFKKFRRKGDVPQSRSRVQAVIVPLEEVTRKEFGIGESYWVTTRQSPETSQNQRSAVSQDHDTGVSRSQSSVPATSQASMPSRRQKQSQKRARERDSDSEDELRFRFRRRRAG